MKKCMKCGNEFPDKFMFCPQCGASEQDFRNDETEAVNEKSGTKKKRISKKGIIIIAAAVLVILIAAGICFALSLPKTLTINSGGPIEIYVGEEAALEVEAEGLSDVDVSEVVWDSGIGNVKVRNGKVSGDYNGSEIEYEDIITGKLNRGIKNWTGTVRVIVKVKPVEYKSGELIKKPSGSRDSYMVLTNSPSNNTYYYLKSENNSDNDMSFILNKGEKKTIYVPCDTYKMYYANGDEWYGTDIMFGPGTQCRVQSDTIKFSSDTYWTIKMESENGNTNVEDVGTPAFPK